MSKLNDYKRPCLELCHPNGRGIGTALRLYLSPATAEAPGFIRLRIADQSGTSDFDWDASCSADLGAVDLAKLLMVFQGWIEKTGADSAGDNKITIRSTNGHIQVDLYHLVQSYVLMLLKSTKDGAKDVVRKIVLSNAEALALTESIRGVLHTVAFGVPHFVEEEM